MLRQPATRPPKVACILMCGGKRESCRVGRGVCTEFSGLGAIPMASSHARDLARDLLPVSLKVGAAAQLYYIIMQSAAPHSPGSTPATDQERGRDPTQNHKHGAPQYVRRPGHESIADRLRAEVKPDPAFLKLQGSSARAVSLEAPCILS